jgi:hypothetical protein
MMATLTVVSNSRLSSHSNLHLSVKWLRNIMTKYPFYGGTLNMKRFGGLVTL